MELKGAVLIIGSLLWDETEHRVKWRKERLNEKEKIHVCAPIQYGRKSDKGGYTMVFSSSNEKLGKAYLIPFKRNLIRSPKGVLNQARFISKAENTSKTQVCNKLYKGTSGWCSIGVLFNPELNTQTKNKILSYWTKEHRKDGGLIDFQKYKLESEEISVLNEKGELTINWPKSVNPQNQANVDKLDFIIATCTEPNFNGEYEASIFLNDRRSYFFKNLEHGINTSRDNEILKLF